MLTELSTGVLTALPRHYFYAEMIDGRVADGMSEEEATA